MQVLTISIIQLLAQTVAPPLLHLVLPELETLADLLKGPELLAVPHHHYRVPRVARRFLDSRVVVDHVIEEGLR